MVFTRKTKEQQQKPDLGDTLLRCVFEPHNRIVRSLHASVTIAAVGELQQQYLFRINNIQPRRRRQQQQ